MYTSVPWDLRRRVLKDSIRHDYRVKEAIKKNLREIILKENIISQEGKKKIKIPLKYLDQYKFRYGTGGGGDGTGHGDAKPGDVIAREVEGEGDGDQAGDQPGERVYEAEIDLEELAKLLFQDLALPWLEEKQEKSIKEITYEFKDIGRKGSLGNIDKRRSLYQNLMRQAAKGYKKVGKFINDDLRYKVWDDEIVYHSNACVYLLMDVSGSMDDAKRYIAKTFFFWAVLFIKHKYDNVDLRFIAHDTEAEIVPEKDFFKLSSSGGTKCSSAYKLALKDIKETHPPHKWNNYLIHFSDGENWGEDNEDCVKAVKELLEEKYITMGGYGEIKYSSLQAFYGYTSTYYNPWTTLHKTFEEKIKHPRFMTIAIEKKEDVYKALQNFFSAENDTRKRT